MSQLLTIARKELRGYFLSPVALIFLAIFLFVVLFAFFWVDTFFRRNIADVRPLFHWLPLLLIFLVSALTMRLWSEEQRMGTLEILLTLPIKAHQLVLGKFLAGLALVAVALVLTLGLPISVSLLGDLDWGPVIGGYLGALLLASAYLAIGLCISSSTDNPIVALLVTVVAGGALYLVGSDAVASFAGHRLGEALRALGSGARFESIQRGVIDLRDLVYYGSLCAGFLYLNVVLLQSKRWSEGRSTLALRSSAKLSVALVAVNLALLNVLLAPVHGARLDMTERGEYSISPVTKKLLRGLDAPLLLRGYFSAKTHPLLAPLVPRIRDMLEEYGAVGGDKVTAEVIDPRGNSELEKEANEAYGIKSVPFHFADRHQAAVVNSYFHVLVKYGDKHEKLDFQQLIEVNVSGVDSVEVKLRNLEYDLTRAIKKVVHGFKPIEELFARAPDKVTFRAYVTPKTLPKNLAGVPALVKKAVEGLAKRSGGKLRYEEIDPGGPGKEKLREQLYRKYGFKPMAASLLSGEIFYLHLLLSMGDRHELLYPSPGVTEVEVKEEVAAALKRLVPGFLKTVGLHVSKPPPPPRFNRMMRRPPPRGPSYELLKRRISETYTVKNVSLEQGRVPGDVDVLLLVGPRDLDEKQRFAVDQFLMRGGAVVICGGRFSLDMSNPTGLTVKKVDSKLEQALSSWGIEVAEQLVLDPQNEAFPVPVERDVMGLRVREVQLLAYPFWVDVRGEGMADGSPVVAGLPSVTLQWASPIELKSTPKIEKTALLSSTKESWTQSGTNVQPDFEKHPKGGFGHDGKAEKKARALAVVAKGSFPSAFKGKPNPLLAGKVGEQAAPAKKGAKKEKRSSVIERSPATARLALVASGDFVRDEVLNLARQTGSDRFINNLRLVQNLIDWSVADVDLLKIRSRGSYARTLAPMEEGSRTTWEGVNYGIVILALLGIVAATLIRRRNSAPMELAPRKKGTKKEKARKSSEGEGGER